MSYVCEHVTNATKNYWLLIFWLILFWFREVITFPGFVDCVYLDAPKEIFLDNGIGDVINIQNSKYEICPCFGISCRSPALLTILVTIIAHAVGQMRFCGIRICRWNPASKILFVWKMPRYWHLIILWPV